MLEEECAHSQFELESPELGVCLACNCALYFDAPDDLVPRTPEEQAAALLTPMLRQEVLLMIAEGAGLKTALRSVGVDRHLWAEWKRSPLPNVAGFVKKVDAAIGKARAQAEIAVHKSNPTTWITKGPGRIDWDEADAWADTTTKVAVSGAVVHAHEHTHTHGINLGKLSMDTLAELEEAMTDDVIEAKLVDPGTARRALPAPT